MYNKHGNPVLSRTPNFLDNCKPFHFVHPFTCMVPGMTASGKTIWVKSLLQQAQRAISLLDQRGLFGAIRSGNPLTWN